MPTIDITNNKLKYLKADSALLGKAITLVDAMARHDNAVSEYAVKATELLATLRGHVVRSRNGEASVEQPAK